MDLSALVALVLALSVASERLVEIVKGFVPYLSKEQPAGSVGECIRRAILQILAVIAGIVTTYLAREHIESLKGLPFDSKTAIVGLGLLASGGSGFWNAILGYVGKVKDIKKTEAEAAKANLSAIR